MSPKSRRSRRLATTRSLLRRIEARLESFAPVGTVDPEAAVTTADELADAITRVQEFLRPRPLWLRLDAPHLDALVERIRSGDPVAAQEATGVVRRSQHALMRIRP